MVIDIGQPAHEDERAALAFLANGLPNSATVFTNPWLIEPSGAVYELDAVVVMPHAIYVVEIKGWRGHLSGEQRDWYLPETRRSPLLLGHKTAQVLRTLLERHSHDAGRAWVQELVFLPAAASFHSSNLGVRKRVALRGEIHAVLNDAGRIRELSNRSTGPADTNEVLDAVTKLLRGAPRQRPLTQVAGFTIIDRFDANDRFREVLGEDTTHTRRLLRIYRIPWDANEAEREVMKKRATWEAGVLRSLARAPHDVCLPLVDPPVETDDGLVVPMEHFDGQTLGAWLASNGKGLDLKARVALWLRIAGALAWTHRAGVVHRQLRPDLVLVKGEADPRDPATPAYRITGFDLAKRHGSKTTIAWSDAALGRLEGAAPEVVQALSDAIPASDQFSLGLLLAHLVLRRPLVESTVPIIERRHRMPHLRDVDADVPQRLDDAVARMLERKPADRFSTVEEAMSHVRAAVDADGAAPARGLAPGARIGPDYVVEGRLGEGGLSDVYQVKHQLLGERFALKVARPTEVAERAIRCEFFALQGISHPSVVRGHDLTKMVEDRITLRLDLVAGVTLSVAVKAAKLPAGDIAARRRLGEDLLGALDEFERIGLVHNDLKPDNLMVTRQGRLVLIDFSLARSPAVEAKMGPVPTFGGTYDWRDPSGEPPGHVTDRYAAAMCLFYLHAARHPFDARVPEPGEAPEFDAIELEPEALERFFKQALSPRPADRFRTARAMRDDYLAALGAPRQPDSVDEGDLTAETRLVDAGLAPRAVRVLQAAQVRTVGDLLALGDDRIGRVPGLGARLLDRVVALVARAKRQGLRAERPTEGDAPPFFRPLEHDPAPLAELQVEVAVLDALRQAGLRTVGAVAGTTRATLLNIPRIGQVALTRLGQALVKRHEHADTSPADTLDGLWERATLPLDAFERDVLERVFGVRGPAEPQATVAALLGSDQPTISSLKIAALEKLDKEVLAPVLGALDGYLDQSGGALDLSVTCERLARDFPTANVGPMGLVRLAAALDTQAFVAHEDLTEPGVAVLTRPWLGRDLLLTFAEAASRVVAGWPPEPPSAVRQTLRMILPDFEGDLIRLAQWLLPAVRTTAGGSPFEPPIDLSRALLYVLDAVRDEVTYDALATELDRVFGGAGPALPPLHELPALLDGTPWKIDGISVVRRGAASAEATPSRGDDPREFLNVDATVDPRDQVRDILREAGRRGSSFRLVVAPAEHHRVVARSLIDQLGATSLDLAHEWFSRHEGTLGTDARAGRFPALRVATGKRLDQLLSDLVRTHGAPGRTVVLHETGILDTLGGLEQIRLMYDRVQGQGVGFWIVVIPGVILERRPLFNDRTAVWHQPGLVLPLTEPLRP
ncbi:MAG: NERD domain-containing protein kinase family protein [Myxococcota bacterium]